MRQSGIRRLKVSRWTIRSLLFIKIALFVLVQMALLAHVAPPFQRLVPADNALNRMAMGPSGFKKMQSFIPVERNTAVLDTYLTLWLHQVHRWFHPTKDADTETRIRKFLTEAKEAGFVSVMGDIPFELTERDAEGDIRLDSFGKDWMRIACEMGLKLHVVISMRELPPWLQQQNATKSFYEYGRCREGGPKPSTTPSMAHPLLWIHAQRFTRDVSTKLLETYGECVQTLSPTWNNEFESRFAQTFNRPRDYSLHMRNEFAKWQTSKGLVKQATLAFEPPDLFCLEHCKPLDETNTWYWLGFREEFIASRYIDMCRIVHEVSVEKDGKMIRSKCLLHFAEMFSTQDFLMTNPFFEIAASPYVDEVVMDSNMALSGAPSSPSITGILVSAAQAYGKVVHFEAATERIMGCGDDGRPLSSLSSLHWGTGASLLLRQGVQNALDAGVQSVGLTNLCVPKLGKDLFGLFRDKATVELQSALPFRPTAVIFVPHRAFYAFAYNVAGQDCTVESTPCWHESFRSIPQFSRAAANVKKRGMCPMDLAQYALFGVWDDLRTRHQQIAVVADSSRLIPELLSATTERVLMNFPCIMTNRSWSFYNGYRLRKDFEERTAKYPFRSYDIDLLDFGSCSVDHTTRPDYTQITDAVMTMLS